MAGEVAGIDLLIYVNLGTEQEPEWTLVGGQRGATLRRVTEVADARHKSSGAWPNRVQTFLDWSITGDAVVIEDDTAMEALEFAWRARDDVQVQIQRESNITETGPAVIADLSLNAPHTDVATISIDLQGNGELVRSPAS
jgi:TP901-1 family phage major tail protein